ncbi:hypothetical protein HT102_00150 [Hoyosella sp. G463]|uniref:Uncharacterized protein n=1 Tax=Lolliginicoccus lacisalsi TaxID=2742202 RepID=A0A927JAL3_9ACTN|nr:hypothetical protein [Lolliginicoccus lacisalsi]MBD8504897.1 hypothetical protein [Lolliginicoccus lacisalsi]
MEYSQLFLAPTSHAPDASPAPEDDEPTTAEPTSPRAQHTQPHAYRDLFSDRPARSRG